jgi:protein-disulfide isomerase
MLRSKAIRFLLSFAAAYIFSGSAAAQQSPSALAVVNGEAITTQDLEQKEVSHLLQAQYQYYQTERKALDDLIAQRLLEQEAHRQGITTDELLKREVDSKVKDPTEDQLQVYYEGLDSKDPYDQVRVKILDHIRDQRRSKLRSAYVETLRQKANIVIQLAPPTADVSAENAAVTEGRSDAPVQVVEFADYQCPYCQKVNPDLNKLIDEYGSKVSVIYRDFPLPMHPHAEKAAEAARCAGQQGKFWEYHNVLFHDKKLDTPDLKQDAVTLRLDSDKFDKCLDSAEEAANVKKDQDEGTKLGLSGTPSFFINGHFISGAVDYATLHQMVEQQLTLLSSAKVASPAGSSQR